MSDASVNFKRISVWQNILASRLKQLVNLGVFEICPASDGALIKSTC